MKGPYFPGLVLSAPPSYFCFDVIVASLSVGVLFAQISIGAQMKVKLLRCALIVAITGTAIGFSGLSADAVPALIASAKPAATAIPTWRGSGYQTLTIRDSRTGQIVDTNTSRSVLPNSIPPGGGGDGGAQGGTYIVTCNDPYRDTGYGAFSYEWLCPAYNAKWDFKLLSAVTAGATTPISETGMAWSRNSKIGPQNAPHPAEGQGYYYHGTLTPNKLRDEIAMSDSWSWAAGRNTYTVYIGYTFDLQN